MASQLSLFDRLSPESSRRATALQLFAQVDRLARKPRCGDDKAFSVIRSPAHALAHPYIQPNSPVAFYRLVFDLDWHNDKHALHNLPVRFLNAERAWQDELGVPAPSWAAISPGKNSAHIGYELAVPVGRHEHARIKPQQFLAGVERGFAVKLQADTGFNGQLCKNPVNAAWELYHGRETGFELRELSEFAGLTKKSAQAFNREPRGEVGRNFFLFDNTRFWAYDNVDTYRGGTFEAFELAVVRIAENINSASYDHIPFLAGRGLLDLAECRHIAKSVARWTWANHGKRELTEAFSELQSWRGKRGAAASAAVKRDRREDAIISAIGQLTAQGQLATMGKVAELLGCSKGGLSMHYKHFFQGTMQ